MTGLTPKQAECLDAIQSYDAEFGYFPTCEDLRERLGLSSKSGVHRLLGALEERHYIRRLRHRARAIEVVRKGAAVDPPTSAELNRFGTPELLTLLAHVCGILGHRLGAAKVRETLDRVGARLAGSR